MTLKEIAEKFGGQLWMKADKIRIYFDYGDDIKAFLEYDADLGDDFQTGIEGANLKVWSADKSKSNYQNVCAAKQIKFEIMKKIAAFTGDEICESWEDVIL